MLDEMLKDFISRLSTNISLAGEQEIQEYLTFLEKERRVLHDAAHAKLQSHPYIQKLGIDIATLFTSSALFISVGTSLQKILIAKLRERVSGGKLGQGDSFTVVDLWGELEASKALLFSLDRRLEEEGERGGSFRADAQVLIESVKSALVDVLKQLGNVESFSLYTPLLDWLIGLSRGAEFDAISDSIRQEIVELAA